MLLSSTRSLIKFSLSYFRLNFKEARGDGAMPARLTAADFHKPSHILCSGFSDGAFFLHEMPDFNLIHSLR